MPFEHTRKCTAKKKRSNEPCNNPAVTGFNVCRVHGAGNKKNPGGRPPTHGRYSLLKRENIRQLIAQHEADPDPLNVLPELAACRALFQDFTDRYDEFSEALIAWHESYQTGEKENKPVRILDLADAYKILAEITKIVERIEKVKAADAISRADLMKTMMEMSRVVQAFVTDESTLEKIRDGWLAIRLN